MKRFHISSLIVIGTAAMLFSAGAPAAESPDMTPPSAPSKEFACSKDKSCPMQKWMKANLGTALASSDFDGLKKGLEFVAAHPPKGYSNWAKIANDGAAAAGKKDLDGVKKSCDGCHKGPDKYRDKYKDEQRDSPFG